MILDVIVADVRARLAARCAATPEDALRARLRDLGAPLDLVAALRQEGVAIIAEIKRASPSAGALNATLDPRQLAVHCATAGAAALSVLTEEDHFGGCLADLAQARAGLAEAGLARPILCKDFIVDPYQLLEARIWGADAVLLIAAILDDVELRSLYAQARELGLTALVEVHNREELGRALAIGPRLVGINNRNLADFSVDLATTRGLRPLIPPETVVISESGIRGEEEMRLLARLGVDAALIGQELVTAADPAARLRALLEAGR